MSNINNTKDNVVFEHNTNTNESANHQQSAKPSFKEIYDKFFGVKVNPDFGRNPVHRTKFGYYIKQFDIGVQRFYRSLMRSVNWLINTAVKLSIVGIFLILLSWYCQQNPEFAAQLNTFVDTVVEAFQNAWNTIIDPLMRIGRG